MNLEQWQARRSPGVPRRSSGTFEIVIVVMTVVSLFTLTGYQITSETAATRLLGRLGGALIEIDRWLPEHREDIELLARDRPEATVRPAALPIAVVLPAASVLEASDEASLRRLLLLVMGRTLYERGADAFVDAEGEPRDLSLDEPLRWTVALLDAGAHGLWKVVLPITLVLLLIPVAGVFLAGRLPLAPLAIGAAVAGVASLASWFLAGALEGAFAAAVDKETALILRDGAWIGLRNSIAVVAASGGILAVTSIMGRPHRDERPWTPRLSASGPVDPDPDLPSA